MAEDNEQGVRFIEGSVRTPNGLYEARQYPGGRVVLKIQQDDRDSDAAVKKDGRE